MDLFTFTEEILNGKLHFLGNGASFFWSMKFYQFFEKDNNGLLYPQAYWEPRHTSQTEFFTKIVNCLKSWTIFTKSSILDVRWGSEYVFDLKHSLQYYLTVDILCCKSHLQMDLQRRKYFTPKKEDIFLIFLPCFPFQNRKDLAQIMFHNAAVRRF